MTTEFRYFDTIMVAFVAVLLISNLASSAKLVDVGVPWFGQSLILDAGTFLFPLSYIFGDVLTEVYGFQRARRVIWLGFGAAALMSATLAIVQLLPGAAEWQEYAGQPAYDAILGGVTSGGIIVASLVAYLFGEFSNSVVLARVKVWMNGRYLWMRTIGSTLVGQAVDTVLFVSIACTFAVFPWSIALSLVVSNYLFKVAVEALFTPITYMIVGFLKQQEQCDVYDRDTSFRLI